MFEARPSFRGRDCLVPDVMPSMLILVVGVGNNQIKTQRTGTHQEHATPLPKTILADLPCVSVYCIHLLGRKSVIMTFISSHLVPSLPSGWPEHLLYINIIMPTQQQTQRPPRPRNPLSIGTLLRWPPLKTHPPNLRRPRPIQYSTCVGFKSR